MRPILCFHPKKTRSLIIKLKYASLSLGRRLPSHKRADVSESQTPDLVWQAGAGIWKVMGVLIMYEVRPTSAPSGVDPGCMRARARAMAGDRKCGDRDQASTGHPVSGPRSIQKLCRITPDTQPLDYQVKEIWLYSSTLK